jgi:hypothetical protein
MILFLDFTGSRQSDQRQDRYDHNNEAYKINNAAHGDKSFSLPNANCAGSDE